MSEFPSIEAQELVTKVFLRAELAELHEEIAGLESTLTVRIGGAIAASAGVLLAGFALLG